MIRITNNSVTLSDGTSRAINPPLYYSEFEDDAQRLYEASRSAPGIEPPDEKWVKALGERLFKRVFPAGFMSDAFQADGTLADGSTLILDIEPSLMDVPWEYLHDGVRFLALNPGIVRYVKAGTQAANATTVQTDPAKSPDPMPDHARDHMKAAILLSSPLLNADPDKLIPVDDKGQYNPFLNQPTAISFREEVASFESLNGLSFPLEFYLHRRTLKQTFRSVISSGYDIIHFTGHGDHGALALETDIATTDLLLSDELLNNQFNNSVKLVVLNACLSAACSVNSESKHCGSMADSFLASGVPLVIAMRFVLSQETGHAFTSSFYKYLSEGQNIDTALSNTRNDLTGENRVFPWDFGIPIMFTSRPDLLEKPLLEICAVGATSAGARVISRGAKLNVAREERFAGRRRELVKAAKALKPGSGKRGILFHGVGGMGKTATALEAAHRFGEDFGEVIFVTARKQMPPPELHTELKGVLPDVTRTSKLAEDIPGLMQQVINEFRLLGYSIEENVQPTARSVARLFKMSILPDARDNGRSDGQSPCKPADRSPCKPSCKLADRSADKPARRLLILDNLEDLLDGNNGDESTNAILDPQLVDFISLLPAGRSKVILTSRVRFTNISALLEPIPLHPLEGMELTEFLRDLLMGRKGVPQDMMDILNKVGGHPFALRLAMMWFDEKWDFADVIRRLANKEGEVWKYLFSETLKKIASDDKIVFFTLSLFERWGRGSVIPEISRLDNRTCMRSLEKLVRFSIAYKTYNPILKADYYGLIPIVKEYSEAVLDELKTINNNDNLAYEIKLSFGSWAIKELNSHTVDYKLGMQQQDKIKQATNEYWNYVTGGDYLERLGLWDKAIELFEQILPVAERIDDKYSISALINRLGNMFGMKGDWGKAEEYYNKSLDTFESLGDRHGIAQTHMGLGLLLADRGDWGKAEEYYNKSLDTFESLGDRHGIAQTYGNLGSLFHRKGDWGKAEEYYNKSLAIDESLGDRHGIAQTFTNLGLLLAQKGDWGKAEEYYNKSLAIKESLGDRHGIAQTYTNLGSLFYRKGDWGKAEEYYNKSLATLESLGDRHGIAQTHMGLGLLLADRGDWGKAEEYYNKSLAIKESLGDRHGIAQTYTNLGSLFYRKGDWGKAEEYYNKSLAIKESLGDRHGIAQNYTNLGSLFYSQGDWGKAEEYYNKSLAIKESLGDRHGIAQSKYALGMALLQKNDLDRGISLMQEGVNILTEMNAPEAEQLKEHLSKIKEQLQQ